MNDNDRPDTTRPTRGRLAPTPTGELHLGNARTFLATWLSIRKSGGEILLRVEDIDRQRSRPEFESSQIENLRWLGLDWDEGPDLGGPFGPYRQSERLELYRSTLEALKASGEVYACSCSRKDIALAAGAPHAGEDQRYPGTCRERGLPADESPQEYAWRVRVDAKSKPFHDALLGIQSFALEQLTGDFVVFRKDGWPSYQLAVALDDALMEVSEVVRGDDLLSSTPRQLLLYQKLGLTAPERWVHLPLVVDTAGDRLAKRLKSLTLNKLKSQGVKPEEIVGALAYSLGIRDEPEPCAPQDLIELFDWSKVPKTPIEAIAIEAHFDRLA